MTEALDKAHLPLPSTALTATVFWGLTPAMTKFVVAEVDPFTVGILRTVVAGPICLLSRWSSDCHCRRPHRLGS